MLSTWEENIVVCRHYWGACTSYPRYPNVHFHFTFPLHAAELSCQDSFTNSSISSQKTSGNSRAAKCPPCFKYSTSVSTVQLSKGGYKLVTYRTMFSVPRHFFRVVDPCLGRIDNLFLEPRVSQWYANKFPAIHERCSLSDGLPMAIDRCWIAARKPIY